MSSWYDIPEEPEMEPCPTCDGDGAIKTIVPDEDEPGHFFTDTEYCRTCDGIGYIEATDPRDPDRAYDERREGV
jgi:hypothetical protein